MAHAIPWLILLFLPFAYFYSETFAVFAFELIAAALALITIFTVNHRQTGLHRGMVLLFSTACAWFLVFSRATWLSCDFSTSWPVLVKNTALILLFFAATRLADLGIFTQSLLKASCYAGIFHGLLAVQEYIEAPPIPATWVDPAMKEHVRTRCAGLFTDPNIFGAFLAVIFIFVSLALLQAESGKEKAIAATALLLTGFAELTTLSRGSWIALACGLTYLLFMIWRRTGDEKLNYRAFFAIIALLLAIALIGPFKYRIFSMVKTQDMTIAQRSLILSGIKKHLNEIPLTGFGPHTFNQVYPRFRAVGGDYPMYAHNELLHSLIETGHFSVLIQLLFLGIVLLPSLRKNTGLASISGAAALLCLFVHNMAGFSSRMLPTAALVIPAGAVTLMSLKSIKSPALNPDLRKLGTLIVVAASVFCSYYGYRSFRVNMLLQQAIDASVQKDFEKSLKLLQNLETLDPTNAIAAGQKATVFLAIGDPEKAKACLTRAVSLNPTEAIYWLKLARLSNKASAEEFYRKAIALDPASELFRLEFARFLVHHGQRDQALAQLHEALRFSPGFHQVYRNYLEIEKMIQDLKNR